MAKPALGRGLGALLGGAPAVPQTASSFPAAPVVLSPPPAAPATGGGESVLRVPLSEVRPSALQPRKDFDPESLQELADSIREQGIVQPLIVRRRHDHFELVAGERRWRAAQLAGLREVPVIARAVDDRTLLEMALIENLQRENLNPLEEARGYARLIEEFELTQEQAAVKVGKSRVAVTNSLRLLKLPGEVQEQLRLGRISVGHAKVILGLEDAASQRLAANRVAEHSWNVRQTEEFVAELQNRARSGMPSPAPASSTPTRDLHVVDLEHRLTERLGTKTSLRYRKGKGSIEIRFFNDDELERVLQLLGVRPD